MRNIVTMREVCFSYGKRTVLEDIDLSLGKGGFLGLIGPNGAGKTTLTRLILGLLKPDSGSVRLLGGNPRGRDNHRKYVGYLPQGHKADYRFPVTVFDVVMMGRFSKIGALRYPGSTDKQEVVKSLEMVGLPRNITGRHFKSLSGGQRQLVFLARALCGNPLLLILDEPTNGLDHRARNKFFKTLATLKKELNLTVIVISHDIAFISSYVDELICINRRIIIRGNPEDVSKNPVMRLTYGYRESIMSASPLGDRRRLPYA